MAGAGSLHSYKDLHVLRVDGHDGLSLRASVLCMQCFSLLPQLPWSVPLAGPTLVISFSDELGGAFALMALGVTFAAVAVKSRYRHGPPVVVHAGSLGWARRSRCFWVSDGRRSLRSLQDLEPPTCTQVARDDKERWCAQWSHKKPFPDMPPQHTFDAARVGSVASFDEL